MIAKDIMATGMRKRTLQVSLTLKAVISVAAGMNKELKRVTIV